MLRILGGGQFFWGSFGAGAAARLTRLVLILIFVFLRF